MPGDAERAARYHVPFGFDLGRAAVAAGATAVVQSAELHLDVAYFDTAELSLLRHGVSLVHWAPWEKTGCSSGTIEHDRVDPSGAVWVLSLPCDTGKAVFKRSELIWAGTLEVVPPEAVSLVEALTLRSGLEPVANLEADRREMDLFDRCGRRLARLYDDRISGGEHASRRIVLERGEAGRAGFAATLRDALSAEGASPDTDCTTLRLALTSRLEATPGRPGHLRSSARMAEVVSATVSDGLERLRENDLGIRLDEDPEFVHQARVATRRLRSDIWALRVVLDKEWVRDTRRDLRWLGTHLGEVRDCDVLATRLAGWFEALAGEEPAEREPAGMGTLVALLASQRAKAYRAALEALASTRYLDLLEKLERASSGGRLPAARGPVGSRKGSRTRPDTSAKRFLGPVLGEQCRKLRRKVAASGSTPGHRGLHRIRVSSKRLRYVAEIAVPVLGEPAKQLAASCSALQDVLGDYNDSIAAERWLQRNGPSATSSVGLARRCVAIERKMQAKLLEEWKDTWEKTDKQVLSWLEDVLRGRRS